MSFSYASITIAGRLSRDPETRYTADGNEVCTCSIPIDNRKKVDGEYTKETTWFNLVLFGKQAELFTRFCQKGDSVTASGDFSERKWVNKEGETRTNLECIVRQWARTNYRPKDEDGEDDEREAPKPKPMSKTAPKAAPKPKQPSPEDYDDDSIPF